MTGLDALFDVELINGFAFDHEDELLALVEGGVLDTELSAFPTGISTTGVTWGDVDNGAVLRGLQWRSTLELLAFLASLPSNLVGGSFSSFDFIVGGVATLQIVPSGNNLSFVSGDQVLSLAGPLPDSIDAMFDIFLAIMDLANADLDGLSDADFDALIAPLNTFETSWFSISDGGQEIFSATLSPESIALRITGQQFVANGPHAVESVGDLLSFGRTLLLTDTFLDVFQPSTIVGTPSAEVLLGNELDNTIVGDAGDDVLRGLTGSDTYIFAPGYGMDQVDDENGENDVIEFLHVANIEDLSISRGVQPSSTWEGTLLLETALDEQVEVKNHFASHGRHRVETLRLSSGDSFTMQVDTIGGAENDLLVGRSVGDFLEGNAGDDVLIAGGDDDVLRGHGGDDILVGETGNDELIGSDGADRYHIYSGDGVDTVVEYDGVADLLSIDQLVLNDVSSLDDIEIGRSIIEGGTWEGHLTFQMGGGDEVTLLNHFSSNGRYVVEEVILAGGQTFKMTKETFGDAQDDLLVGRSVVDYLKGRDGHDYLIAGGKNDVLFGNSGDDTLIGQTGNDHLRGGDGADRYILNAGDGQDLITEYDGIEDLISVDVIVFNDITDISDLTLSRVAESGATSQGSLLIEVDGTSDSVRVQHHFASNDRYKIEQIELGDGTVYQVDDLAIA